MTSQEAFQKSSYNLEIFYEIKILTKYNISNKSLSTIIWKIGYLINTILK